VLDIGQISAYDVFHHPNKSKLFAQYRFWKPCTAKLSGV